MVILGYRVVELLKKTWSEVWKDNVLGMSAEAAYNLFFSLFPLLLFVAPLLMLRCGGPAGGADDERLFDHG